MLSQVIKFAVEGIPVADSMYASSFYVDDDDDNLSEEEEVLFCKNNICVHFTPSDDLKDIHIPGYLSIKSRTRQSGHVRLILSWTPNSHFSPRSNEDKQCSVARGNPIEIEVPPRVNEVFIVDLGEMKSLKLFFDEEDASSGQFVVGNHENHYKVFHFHHGGLNRVNQILQDWHWCTKDYLLQEDIRKVCYTVINRKVVVEQDFHPEEGRFSPMSMETWRTYANEAGQIEDVANFKKVGRRSRVFALQPEVVKMCRSFSFRMPRVDVFVFVFFVQTRCGHAWPLLPPFARVVHCTVHFIWHAICRDRVFCALLMLRELHHLFHLGFQLWEGRKIRGNPFSSFCLISIVCRKSIHTIWSLFKPFPLRHEWF